MSGLSLRLLGSPRIERDGALVKVDTRKAIALLAYLAVTGERHTRDALATLLWPESSQSRARAALRRTLSALRKALGGEWLDVTREAIGLYLESNLQLDVAQFNELLADCGSHGHPLSEVCPACLTPLREAVDRYQGDFLTGFTLRDSLAFDEWQFFQSESLRRELANALERLARLYATQREFETAIKYARRWLTLDKLNEVAHQQLMQLSAWTGQRNVALRQYQECARILEGELGVLPLEETTQLYQAIKESRLSPPPDAHFIERSLRSSVEEPGSEIPQLYLTPDELPLTGRASELASITRTYQAIRDNGLLIVLQGEAGVGKTRLAEEFLRNVQARGANVIAARCYEGEAHLVYGPLIEGLRTVVGSEARPDLLAGVASYWMIELARLLPDVAESRPDLPSPPLLDNPGAQSRFFEGIKQVLLTILDAPPVGVLFLDDVHWADTATIDLLSYLVRRLSRQPLCILITWRSELVHAGHRLHQLLSETQRSSMGIVLSLSRLSEAAVLELVQSVGLSIPASPEVLSEQLYRETEGLPFFLAEYLGALSKGKSISEGEEWMLLTSVRDLLRSRLASVSETGKQLLHTAAVIGRFFDFDTLRLASGRSEEETVSALETLIAQGLIEEVDQSDGDTALYYDFYHEKLRTLVYDETSLARRRRLHRRVAEALLNRSRRRHEIGLPVSQIAQHYKISGRDREAANYFHLSGEYARSLYANQEALAHFQSALALGHPDTANLHQAIGDMQTLLGKYNAAIGSYETAASLSQPEKTAAIEHKLGQVYHRLGEWELAESHFRSALDVLGKTGDEGKLARLFSDWSHTAHQSGQSDQAQKLAHRALALAESVANVRALAQAHNILGILANGEGDLKKARIHLQSSLGLAEQLDDPSARVAALNNLALTSQASGEFERALELTEAALELCTSQGDRHREAALRNNMADFLHAAGQSEAAMSQLKQAVSLFAEIGADGETMQPEIWKLVEW